METPVQSTVTRSISLDPETDEIVSQLQATLPFPNHYSAAMRAIVREWAVLKAEKAAQHVPTR